jgi:hypothetical protein
MDSNPCINIDLNESNSSDYKNKKFLIVKLPANVRNAKKASELLGGKDKILSKFLKDEDLELSNVFSKKIPLEKCLNNDFVLKRKRMRNKLTGEKKFKFEIKGRVDSMYEYFALHDFVCFKGDQEQTDLKNLESKILKIFIKFFVYFLFFINIIFNIFRICDFLRRCL